MSEIKPVALIGSAYQLLWADSAPLSTVAEEHNIKVGDYLYSAETVQQLQRENSELKEYVKQYSGKILLHLKNENILRAELAAAKQRLAEAENKFNPDWANFLGGK